MIFQPESPLPKINSAIFTAASLHFSFGIPDSYLPTWADTGFGKFTRVLPGQRAPDLAQGQGDSLGVVTRKGRILGSFLACPYMLKVCVSAVFFRGGLDDGITRCFLPTSWKEGRREAGVRGISSLTLLKPSAWGLWQKRLAARDWAARQHGPGSHTAPEQANTNAKETKMSPNPCTGSLTLPGQCTHIHVACTAFILEAQRIFIESLLCINPARNKESWQDWWTQPRIQEQPPLTGSLLVLEVPHFLEVVNYLLFL